MANGLLVDPFVKFLNGEIRSAQKEQKRLQADVTETKMKLTDAQNQVTRIKKEKESMETELLQFKTRCKALETALQNKLKYRPHFQFCSSFHFYYLYIYIPIHKCSNDNNSHTQYIHTCTDYYSIKLIYFEETQ